MRLLCVNISPWVRKNEWFKAKDVEVNLQKKSTLYFVFNIYIYFIYSNNLEIRTRVMNNAYNN